MTSEHADGHSVRPNADCAPTWQKELGFHPATLDPDDLARHRRVNAALDLAPSQERISRKYAHLARNAVSVTSRLRARRVADLYE